MFEKLIESASTFANEEFVNQLKEVAKTTETNINGLTEKATVYERDMKTAIEKRDGLNSLVKGTFGIDEINEDSLKSVIDNPDVSKLQDLLRAKQSEYEATVNSYETKIRDTALNVNILESGLLDGVKSPLGKKLLLDELRNGAIVSEDGSIGYVDDKGVTVYATDGKPLAISDKVNSLYENEDYKVFFPVKKGGGKQGGDNSGGMGLKDISKMTRSEKAQLMSELSPADYQKLVQQSLNKTK